jgi:dihydrofolate reductase
VSAAAGAESPLARGAITLLVACADRGVIGRDNTLPWHLPEDLRHFRDTTLGHALIMGRRTFASIGRPLPGRHTIVLTRDPTWHHPGCAIAHRLADAIDAGRSLGRGEIFVVGGAQVYRDALPMADRVLMTRIALDVAGDAFFPPLSEAQWAPVHREARVAANGIAFEIIDWRPRNGCQADTARHEADRR